MVAARNVSLMDVPRLLREYFVSHTEEENDVYTMGVRVFLVAVVSSVFCTLINP